MEKNIEIIVQITEQLRNSKQGRYLENIADLCKTKHGWHLTTTKAAIEEATQQQKIYTSVMNGISYRKRKEKTSTGEERFRDADMQTDPITELPCRKDDEDLKDRLLTFKIIKSEGQITDFFFVRLPQNHKKVT